MAKDAVTTLDETRQKLIKKLVEKKRQVEDQLKGLGHDDKKNPTN